MEEARIDFKISSGKPTVKRLFGRTRCRCEDSIRIYLNEVGINTRDWVDSVHDFTSEFHKPSSSGQYI